MFICFASKLTDENLRDENLSWNRCELTWEGEIIRTRGSSFEMTARSGVPPARVHVRCRVNMGNKDFETANSLAPIAQRQRIGAG